ncbi:DUF1992 domain-containing protein [Streptomyces sclerotialus]|uniref:DnaJ family domain-containing protein n=1 Tax=Streptomyces sclerotialus TaxID=1957 RepID=UPI0004C659BC
MTDRKPPGVSFETWVDRQIREAAERGEFDDLPGAGQPLKGLDKPYDEMWWVRDKMERESLSCLPPTLTLRKEAEDALAAARGARSEREVRRIVADINDKIREALKNPPPGPPLGLSPFDAEKVVGNWRADLRERVRKRNAS